MCLTYLLSEQNAIMFLHTFFVHTLLICNKFDTCASHYSFIHNACDRSDIRILDKTFMTSIRVMLKFFRAFYTLINSIVCLRGILS